VRIAGLASLMFHDRAKRESCLGVCEHDARAPRVQPRCCRRSASRGAQPGGAAVVAGAGARRDRTGDDVERRRRGELRLSRRHRPRRGEPGALARFDCSRRCSHHPGEGARRRVIALPTSSQTCSCARVITAVRVDRSCVLREWHAIDERRGARTPVRRAIHERSARFLTHATELLFFGELFLAERALEIGFVNRVVPDAAACVALAQAWATKQAAVHVTEVGRHRDAIARRFEAEQTAAARGNADARSPSTASCGSTPCRRVGS